MAYSYSVFITACFGLLATEIGSTSVLRIFAFLLGATTAFAIVETIASRGFRDRFRSEPSDVVMLGSALALFSVSVAVAAAWACTAILHGAWAWFVAPFGGSIVYILVSGAEMALARRREEEHPPENEEPQTR